MDDPLPDAKAEPCETLGLADAPKSPLVADPQRLARQAIRSQAAAREYAERHLLRAEQMLQDLAAKLYAVRCEKDAALEAARTARAVLAQTERDLRAVEAALNSEKAARERTQREVQEARATVGDLRTKLALANQSVEALRTELQQERQARSAAEQERSVVQTSAAVDGSGETPGNQPVNRRRGRPPGKRLAAVPPPAAAKLHSDNQEPVRWWIKGWTPKS